MTLTTTATKTEGLFTLSVRGNGATTVIMLAILFSLKTMESLKNGLQPLSGAPPLLSMRTVSLASLQSCRSVDTDP